MCGPINLNICVNLTEYCTGVIPTEKLVQEGAVRLTVARNGLSTKNVVNLWTGLSARHVGSLWIRLNAGMWVACASALTILKGTLQGCCKFSNSENERKVGMDRENISLPFP